MTNQSNRITVIGGGIVGMSCAHALQSEGFSVEVVDAGTAEDKCSYGNAGAISAGSVAPLAMPGTLRKVPGMLADPTGPLFVRPTYALKAAPWLWRFARAARPRKVQAIAVALNSLLGPAVQTSLELAQACGAAHLIRRTGQLHLYPDAAALNADHASWQLRRQMGVSLEVIGPEDIHALEPAVGDQYRTGVFMPDEGMVIDPWGLRTALADDFLQRGGRIIAGHVDGFSFGPDGPDRLLLDGEAHPVDQVIIAAGAWSGRLAAALGHRVPLESQRGYHVSLMNPEIQLQRPVVAADRKCFITPLDGSLRIAGTVEFAGLEAAPDYRRARHLLGHGSRLLPGMRTDTYTEWMGHRPCLPDSLPIIGRTHKHRNVFFAFGHGHLGLTGAAVTARQIAHLVAGRDSTVDLAPFRIDRF
ncbi:MAG: FAD-binding oxidoreductase [Aquisalimonadaceae bacterium]